MLSQLIHRVRIVMWRLSPWRRVKCSRCGKMVRVTRRCNGVYQMRVHHHELFYQVFRCSNSKLIFGTKEQ